MTVQRELVVLVADGTMSAVFRAFFERSHLHLILGCAPFDFDPANDVFHDPLHTDGGVYRRAHEILRPYLHTHQRALVVLDQQFGAERPAAEVRTDIETRLNGSGWDGRATVVVIDPELEIWLWQDNANVERALGHKGPEALRHQLAADGRWPDGLRKPPAPKELIRHLIRQNRAGPPMVVYSEIARRVSVDGCLDRAFLRLRNAFQTWFPPE